MTTFDSAKLELRTMALSYRSFQKSYVPDLLSSFRPPWGDSLSFATYVHVPFDGILYLLTWLPELCMFLRGISLGKCFHLGSTWCYTCLV